MTTHNNTTKDQHHRAPLNGLITGTTVGAIWDTVFVILYVKSNETIDPKEYPSLFLMSLIFPLVGWLTGLWERRTFTCDNPKEKRFKIEIIGVAMASLTKMLMYATGFLLADHRSLESIEVAMHPLPLIVFPFAGLALSVVGIRLRNSRIPFILSMSIASAAILFIAVVVWFHFLIVTSMSLPS
ncbi:MAG: adhesin [Cutibacterium avidum]|nr:adhesin [Cutibacterium avidum]